MVRYVVKVVVDGRTASVLVVLPDTALVLTLVDKIKARLPGLNLGVTSTTDLDLTLHINEADSPILDTEDLLSDVLPDSTKEQLVAVIGSAEAPSHSTVSSIPTCSILAVFRMVCLILLTMGQNCSWNLSLLTRALHSLS